MQIFLIIVSKYAKKINKIYLSMCTLISIKTFETWNTVKNEKLSNPSDRNLKNVCYVVEN